MEKDVPQENTKAELLNTKLDSLKKITQVLLQLDNELAIGYPRSEKLYNDILAKIEKARTNPIKLKIAAIELEIKIAARTLLEEIPKIELQKETMALKSSLQKIRQNIESKFASLETAAAARDMAEKKEELRTGMSNVDASLKDIEVLEGHIARNTTEKIREIVGNLNPFMNDVKTVDLKELYDTLAESNNLIETIKRVNVHLYNLSPFLAVKYVAVPPKTPFAAGTLETPSIPESANANLGGSLNTNTTKQIVDATKLTNGKTAESETPVAGGQSRSTLSKVFQVVLRIGLLLVRIGRINMLGALALKLTRQEDPLFIYFLSLLAIFAEALIMQLLSNDAKSFFAIFDILFDALSLFFMLAIFVSGNLDYSTAEGFVKIFSFSAVLIGFVLRVYNEKKTPGKEIVDMQRYVKFVFYLFSLSVITYALITAEDLSLDLLDLTVIAVIFYYAASLIRPKAVSKSSYDKLQVLLTFVFVLSTALLIVSFFMILVDDVLLHLGQTQDTTFYRYSGTFSFP